MRLGCSNRATKCVYPQIVLGSREVWGEGAVVRINGIFKGRKKLPESRNLAFLYTIVLRVTKAISPNLLGQWQNP